MDKEKGKSWQNKNNQHNQRNNPYKQKSNHYNQKGSPYQTDHSNQKVPFINPYHFVPLPKSVSTRTSEKDRKTGTLGGVIEYELLTKSPLFIPNSSSEYAFCRQGDKEKGHKSYDFFSYQSLSGWEMAEGQEPAPRQPVIPGSEMRGLLRSAYEIVTDSCLFALDDKKVLSKRMPQPFKAGLIKKEGQDRFSLWEAENNVCCGTREGNKRTDWKGRYRGLQFGGKPMKEGTHVRFDDTGRKTGNSKIVEVIGLATGESQQRLKVRGGGDGYLVLGESGPRKKWVHIFSLKLSSHPVRSPLDVKGLNDALTLYEDNRTATEKSPAGHGGGKASYEAHREYREKWEEFCRNGKIGDYFPVYYDDLKNSARDNGRNANNEKGLVMLSPSCITREVYPVILSDLAGQMKPCTSKDSLCPACSLFGTLLGDGAVATRIRVTDLISEERKDSASYYNRAVTLKPLASPKISSTEFYLQRPKGARFWTYSYYLDEAGNVHIKNAQLAGRKFYWHNPEVFGDKHSEFYGANGGERTNQNITVRPVKSGVTFSGRIFFDRLTEQELNSLIYVLESGDCAPLFEKKHGLKLGMAKPLGFGSVAMEVKRVMLHSYEAVDGIIQAKDEDRTEVCREVCEGAAIKNKAAFQRMTDFQAIRGSLLDGAKREISYPKLQEGDNGYEWFVKNHGGIAQRKKVKINQYLLDESNQVVPAEPKLKNTGIQDQSMFRPGYGRTGYRPR